MNKKQYGILLLACLFLMFFTIVGCGEKEEPVSQGTLGDTSDQVIPGAEWKGEYQALNTTYVNINDMEDAEKAFSSDNVFVLDLEESGIASLTLDPALANTLAKKPDDYTQITLFDLKWVEEDDTLVLRSPEMNMSQMVCSRVTDSDFLKLDIQYTKASSTMYLKPAQAAADNITAVWIEQETIDSDGNKKTIDDHPIKLKFADNGLGTKVYYTKKGKKRTEEFLFVKTDDGFTMMDGYNVNWSCTVSDDQMTVKAKGKNNDDPLTYIFTQKK